ncbi:molybdenum cofactor sulfurase 3 [Coccinella septempunctata]|uniref:molybdenum cofactor sulfurase 3 n=1 Tax=Coccinella septempunctata TaxID=41139 RepID=UPI001D07A59C|nr:molybdenum cofactor sulfurase 3 [Coccinella septempunctata]
MDKFTSFESVYSDEQNKLIEREFQRIKDEHFLDHAGGTLYSEKQVDNIMTDLKQSLLCNPHGKNFPSQKTEDAIDIIRFRILQHFHTNSEEYTVIFTANTTSSLKLIAENFDFKSQNGQKGVLAHLEDNHTSVLGMRNYSEVTRCVTVQEAFDFLGASVIKYVPHHVNTKSLFVYPAQCNFSGTKFPLDWIERIHNGQLNVIEGLNSGSWYVLLDAATFVGSNDLDLSTYKPDFVTFSFYKMFGYPTGVGALLVRNESQKVLLKKYYGGGTVLMALARENEAILKTSLAERYEDGTLPYLSIYSLNEGFNTFIRLKLTIQSISKHVFNLAKYFYTNLITLHHANGKPAAILYHDTTFQDARHQGGIVNFNLVRENGEFIGYSEVMQMLSLNKIHIRTGCSCNPGACQRHLKLTSDDIRRHFRAGHVCGDQNDLVDGVPTGSVRVSFGYMSTKENADAALRVIEDCFVQKPIIKKLPQNWTELSVNYENRFRCKSMKTKNSQLNESQLKIQGQKIPTISKSLALNAGDDKFVTGVLKYIFLYPVKSCGALEVPKSWRISSSGLEYDRKWMIVNSDGACLSQKHNPKMCLIKPFIDLERKMLKLEFPGEESITLLLHDPARKKLSQCESKICRDRVIGYDCGEIVSNWLNKCLGCKGLRLIQQTDHQIARVNTQGQHLQLSFANESQYLMVNLASVKWLRDRVKKNDEMYSEDLKSLVLRFRPNIVIDFDEPFVENELECVDVDTISFKTVGSCARCQMICINQVNAQKTKEPLITLAKEFHGKVKFGVYLGNVESEGTKDTVYLGCDVLAKRKMSDG